MKPIQTTVDAAIRAAQQVVAQTRALREQPTLRVDSLHDYADSLQRLFEQISPVAALDPARVQADVEARYSPAPADALAMIGAGQLAGQAAVAAAWGTYLAVPEARDRVFDQASALSVVRTVSGGALTDLHAAMDALLAALAPIDPAA